MNRGYSRPDAQTCGARTLAARASGFSPDGKLLGAAKRDGVLRRWDVAAAKLLHVLPSEHQAQCLAFSPDGKMMASGGNYGTVQFWDVATGKEQAAIRGGAISNINALAFSPDGQRIAAGGRTGLGLWDVTARKNLYRKDPMSKYRSGNDQHGLLWFANQWIHSLRLSPDGKTLAAWGESSIRLWEVAGGKELLHRSGHEAWVNSLIVSPDGRIVASTSCDGTLCLWDSHTGRLLQQPPGIDYASAATSLSSDGRLVASGSDGFVHLWETATGKERGRFCHRDFQSDGVAGSVQTVRFSPDGKRLAVLIRAGGRTECHIGVWDTTSGKLLKHRQFEGKGGESSLTPDASGVTVLVRGKMAIEEAAIGKRLVTFPHVEDLLPIAFSPGGRLVAAVRRGAVNESEPMIGRKD